LLTTQFPDSIVAEEGVVPAAACRATCVDWRVAARIFTYSRVEQAISSFAPYKSLGMDGIFPALLQEGWGILSPYLVRIFRTCLVIGYVPALWHQAKVVFIPKPSRSSYCGPRDFKPISLTSFLLKTMKRLVDRFLRDEILALQTLHPNQHAYQAGKSVGTALHQLIVRVEKALDQQEIALGVFLDIKGVFDNTSYDSIRLALTRHGVDHTIVRWIRATLEGWLVTTALGGISRGVTVSSGCPCPQGGSYHPWLWKNCWQGSMRGVFMCRDMRMTCLLAVGKFPNTVSGLIQWALHTVELWCAGLSLSVNPDKTRIVTFTRKRKLTGFFVPRWFGKTLKRSMSVKYLGVILDSHLTWKEHVDVRVKKAQNSMWACRRACGVTWGLKPRVVHWLYVAIIRSSVTFTSLVWWPGFQMASAKRKLSRVQRLACLGITGAMRTTPTNAVEALICLPPLDLVVQSEARSAAHRLWSLGCWSYLHPNRGHSNILMRLQQSDPMFNIGVDIMRPAYNFELRYGVTMLTREDWTKATGAPPAVKGLVWFTDGSRTGEGTGAGVYGQSVGRRLRFSLGRYATVFQAEIYAILACVYEIKSQNRPEKYVSAPIVRWP
jgi:hypothetical protein